MHGMDVSLIGEVSKLQAFFSVDLHGDTFHFKSEAWPFD